MPTDDVMVSVLLTTYNQAAFIREALDGVLMQETDFAWELLVGEDCSTDGTRAIVEEYAARHPTRIRAVLQERNIGGHANFDSLLRQARGRYIAWVEGDDAFVDPQKLARQVAYLEAHPEAAICFHRARIVRADGQERRSNKRQRTGTGLADICVRCYIRTPTVMWRAGLVSSLPEWVHALPSGDWPLFVLLAEHGSIGFLEREMSMLRRHARGVWSGMNRAEQRASNVRVADAMRRNVAASTVPHMNAGYLRVCYRALTDALRRFDLRRAPGYLVRVVATVVRHPTTLGRLRRARRRERSA